MFLSSFVLELLWWTFRSDSKQLQARADFAGGWRMDQGMLSAQPCPLLAVSCQFAQWVMLLDLAGY
jgi:hypothetical protein